MKLKLFLLSRSVNKNYDTYDQILVAAENAEDAKTINPDGNPFKDEGEYSSWVRSIDDILLTEIGEANENILGRGVVMASFNAG